MSEEYRELGSVCRYCLKIWDGRGRPFAQSHNVAPWVAAGYKLVVCEKCKSKRACENHKVRTSLDIE